MSREEEFAALVSEVAREIGRRRSSDACCGDLTLEQFETLRAVMSAEVSTIGSLSTALSVDVSTMSRNVSVLDRNGYLGRARSADDGRVVHVKLTPKGRGALTTLRCSERDVLADVYEQIPVAERANVIRALGTLRESLSASPMSAACCAPAPVQIRRKAS